MKSFLICLFKKLLKHPLYPSHETQKKILSQSLKDKNKFCYSNTVNYSGKMQLIEKMKSRGVSFKLWGDTGSHFWTLKGSWVPLLNIKGLQGPGVPRLRVLVSLLNHTKSFPSFAIFLFSGKVYIRDISQNIWFNCLNKLRQLNQIFWEISRKNCNKIQSFQNC